MNVLFRAVGTHGLSLMSKKKNEENTTRGHWKCRKIEDCNENRQSQPSIINTVWKLRERQLKEKRKKSKNLQQHRCESDLVTHEKARIGSVSASRPGEFDWRGGVRGYQILFFSRSHRFGGSARLSVDILISESCKIIFRTAPFFNPHTRCLLKNRKAKGNDWVAPVSYVGRLR
jgi:hypothetical protein